MPFHFKYCKFHHIRSHESMIVESIPNANYLDGRLHGQYTQQHSTNVDNYESNYLKNFHSSRSFFGNDIDYNHKRQSVNYYLYYSSAAAHTLALNEKYLTLLIYDNYLEY